MGQATAAHTALRNMLIISGASLSSSAAGFLLVTIAARRLGVAGFGQFSTVQILVTSLAVLADVGLVNVVVREVAQHRDRTPAIAGGVALLRIGLASIAVVCCCVLAWALGYDPYTRKLVLVFSLMLIPQSVGAGCASVFSGFEQMGWLAIIWIVSALAYVVAAVLMTLGWGLTAVFATLTVGSALGAVVGLAVLYYRFEVKRPFLIDTAMWLRYLREAYPYGLMAIVGMLSIGVGPLALRSMKGEAELGYYNCAYAVASVLLIVTSAYGRAIFPVFSRLQVSSREAMHRSYTFTMKVILAVGLPAAVGLTILAPLITILFPGYGRAVPVLQTLIWYAYFALLATPPLSILYAEGKQMESLLIHVIAAAVCLCLVAVMIGRYGMMGVCLPMVACTALMALLSYRRASPKCLVSVSRLAVHCPCARGEALKESE